MPNQVAPGILTRSAVTRRNRAYHPNLQEPVLDA
jgi:hypothetical protein